MFLVGDIGGTNVRLALTEPGSTEPLRERRYATADFADFESVLAAYLADTRPTITAGCLAVAGPIGDDGRHARLTNLPWTIDAAELAAGEACARPRVKFGSKDEMWACLGREGGRAAG